MFSDQELVQQVKEALVEGQGVIDPNARGAFFTAVTTSGVKGVLALKVANGWDLNLFAEHEFTKDEHGDEAGILLRGEW